MQIRTTVEITAPANAAWQSFGEGWGEWSSWAAGIHSSTLEGPLTQGVIRVVETEGLGAVRQELVQFDTAARNLVYDMSKGLPPFLERVRNDWSIEPLTEDRCRLVGDVTFELAEKAADVAEA